MVLSNGAVQYFYASTRKGHAHRLLLGPFTEKAVADTTIDVAKELAYLSEPTPTDIEVISISLPAGSTPPAGALNDMAMSMYAEVGGGAWLQSH